MSNLEIDVLRILRVFGPCSNADVARRIVMPPNCTYVAIFRLVQRGMATHPKKQRWDITRKGRRYFERTGLNDPRLFVEVER